MLSVVVAAVRVAVVGDVVVVVRIVSSSSLQSIVVA